MTRALLLLLCSCTALQHTYRVVFRDVHAAFRNEDIHSAAFDLGVASNTSRQLARVYNYPMMPPRVLWRRDLCSYATF